MGDVSTVRVARAPPNLGRAAPWSPDAAKRCLFGVPDPKQLQALYDKVRNEHLETNSLRWEFDFLSEEPLDGGHYAWKKIRRDNGPADTADKSESSTTPCGCEDRVLVKRHIPDYMRKRKLSSNQTKTSSKAEPNAKRRSST